MLLHRYNSLESLTNLPIDSFLALCLTALEKEKEEKIFSQWVAHLPMMSAKFVEYISFKDYKDKVTGKNIDMRSNEEIIKEIEELHARNGGK